uniref:Uncharacterized protein n=1 Tax=viral metagenome TaxID=1070528 RepID=A0A6H2A291_9ZZZZ
MLGQVPGDNQHESVQSIEVRDLSMRSQDKPVNNPDQAPVPEPADRPPESRFTNILVHTELGLFYIYCSIIGPVPEDPKYRVPLPARDAQRELEAIADLIKALEEKSR